MHNRSQIARYLAGDVLSAIIGWTFSYIYILNLQASFADPLFFYGLAIITVFWICFFYIWGIYRDPSRRSRLKELGASVSASLTGTAIIFVLIIPGITGTEITGGFKSYIILFFIYFSASYLPRLFLTTRNTLAIRKGEAGFKTLLIGSDKNAVEIYLEINSQLRSTGNKMIGYVSINGKTNAPLAHFLKHLGDVSHLSGIIREHGVDEVIIAIESGEHPGIAKIIDSLDYPGLVVKAIPTIHDIIAGRVRISTVIETPLITLSGRSRPAWQGSFKYALDITLSAIALIFFFPVSILIMAWIKIDSRGPVIYSHERIGRNGKPFRIFKFRTMIDNAEKNGPELSSVNDSRITVPGRFLRKTRLDEIPNFINVLKGDMSLVGPRPERRYYIDQIMKKAPHYKHLLKIKPGITSWGQIKYGYAENVEQMIQRLKYDIIYLENMSLFVDIQILILTVAVIFKRDGV
jgi:exopolysaccharide biosynthesis polyprenyl glycosylphosphotransferase